MQQRIMKNQKSPKLFFLIPPPIGPYRATVEQVCDGQAENQPEIWVSADLAQ